MSLTAVLNATLLDDDVARHTIDYEQKQEQRHLVGKIVEGTECRRLNKGLILFCFSVFVHKPGLTAPCMLLRVFSQTSVWCADIPMHAGAHTPNVMAHA